MILIVNPPNPCRIGKRPPVPENQPRPKNDHARGCSLECATNFPKRATRHICGERPVTDAPTDMKNAMPKSKESVTRIISTSEVPKLVCGENWPALPSKHTRMAPILRPSSLIRVSTGGVSITMRTASWGVDSPNLDTGRAKLDKPNSVKA